MAGAQCVVVHFRWPSASDVSRFLGGDDSSSGSDFADRLDVLERNQRDMPANVKQSIARDVAEHRFAVAGDGSVGTLPDVNRSCRLDHVTSILDTWYKCIPLLD
eukprot:SAG11_NODE_19663_length_461_cov_3.732044_1_plen_104_part_00